MECARGENRRRRGARIGLFRGTQDRRRRGEPDVPERNAGDRCHARERQHWRGRHRQPAHHSRDSARAERPRISAAHRDPGRSVLSLRRVRTPERGARAGRGTGVRQSEELRCRVVEATRSRRHSEPAASFFRLCLRNTRDGNAAIQDPERAVDHAHVVGHSDSAASRAVRDPAGGSRACPRRGGAHSAGPELRH